MTNKIILGADTGDRVIESKCASCLNLIYEEETFTTECPYFNVDINDVVECGRYVVDYACREE